MAPARYSKGQRFNPPTYQSTHCSVCGRALPDRTGKRGRPTVYCPPKRGQARSDCATLDKRCNEVARLARNIARDLGSEDEGARRTLQKLKSYIWSEMNSATNLKKLVSTGQPRYAQRRNGWWREAPTKR